MGKSALFILVIFLVGLAYFWTFNREPVTIAFSPKTIYETSKIVLILLSSAAGIALTLVYFFIRDTKRFIDGRQFQRRQKQDMKVQELYAKALNAILADNEEEARSALEEILKEDPGHLDANLRLGDISAESEDYLKAISYYKKAKEVQPHNFEVLFSLARVMEKTNRPADARVYLDEILDTDPDNLTALYKKRALMEKKDEWDEVIYLQKTIIKSEHTEKEREREQKKLLGYKYEQGRYSLENGQYEKAKKTFRTIIRLDRNFVPASLGLAEVMLREGETEDAIDFLEKTFEQTLSVIILARIEDLLISVGEPARLIRLYKNALSREPQNQTLNFFMGKLYYRLEMIDDAFDALVTVDSSGAPYPELHYLLADIYVRRQQWDRAVGEFKKVIDLRKPFRLPYCCEECGYASQGWAGRCVNCKSWNTYQFNLYGRCKA
ncbi:MAG TPA: tetratricopeptide repeat protein [Thermodesulfovibrionales bacterium]|nr:tetratricopeptide repeat protein [Thermodesulfovibrionales bacterium]